VCYWKDNTFHPSCPGWSFHEEHGRPVIQHTSSLSAPTENEYNQLNAEDFEFQGGEYQHQYADRPKDSVEIIRLDLDIGDFAAIKYDNEVFADKILHVETTNGEYYISFMEKDLFHEYHLRLPKSKDEVWVRLDDIISKINFPTPQRRSGRCFLISQDDRVFSWIDDLRCFPNKIETQLITNFVIYA